MARIKNNVLLSGVSGRVGNLVFKVRNGKTFVSARPKTTKAPTEKMLKSCMNCALASQYAKAALADPERSAFYKAVRSKGKSAYRLAVADYLKAPVIESVKVFDCTGEAETTLFLIDVNKTGLAKITISIEDQNGNLVESGDASGHESLRTWYYQATTPNLFSKGKSILVRAWDVPGKMAETMRELKAWGTK
jgi:hypothetical protein